ncbi:MAG: 4-hydroxythreonine-4-phosphate dehydrogenase PdxA [Deltaproteobacteria bacterium]|nr:4-hydroxythreonine-4-phosphate dehydrogenase PdxA [Deltaproteobacteria bacterium]
MSPRIGVSMGCPAGVGPEVIARALAARPTLDVTVFGDEGVLTRASARTGASLSDHVKVVPVTRLAEDEAQPGEPSEITGRAQLDYLAAAADAVLAGKVQALVTAPISREWAARAGRPFASHMEFLASRAGAKEYATMQLGGGLRVTLVTGRVPFRQVPALLSTTSIARTTVLTAQALSTYFGIRLPRVAVAGLNPLAGEGGRLGDDETHLVLPAVNLAQRLLSSSGLAGRVSGPHEPDTVFREMLLGDHDAVVALYHDQGQIPIKFLAFEEAVSLTLGLPFVRTSPDHGTAYDIAGTGRAKHKAFLTALDLACAVAEKSLAVPDTAE